MTAETPAPKDTPESIARQIVTASMTFSGAWQGSSTPQQIRAAIADLVSAALRAYGKDQRRVGAADMRERARQAAAMQAHTCAYLAARCQISGEAWGHARDAAQDIADEIADLPLDAQPKETPSV